MPRFTSEKLEDLFTYHPPTPEQLPRYQAIRDGAKLFARVIAANTPEGADQSAAIREVRVAMMTANAAIATNGKN
jgi:hypothetical protein